MDSGFRRNDDPNRAFFYCDTISQTGIRTQIGCQIRRGMTFFVVMNYRCNKIAPEEAGLDQRDASAFQRAYRAM